MNPQDRELHTAIFLNNSGVSLLQRECYHQGFRTLSGAVSVMNGIVTSRLIQGKDSVPMFLEQTPPSLARLVHETEQRLATPKPSQHSGASISVKSLSDLHQEQESSPPQNSTGLVFCLLKIDPEEFDESSFQDKCEIQASTILHNFGITYRCLASISELASTRHQFLMAAFNIFHSSYSIINNRCAFGRHNSSSNNNNNNRQDTFAETGLALCIVTASHILTNLAELSKIFGRTQDELEYKMRLEVLQKAMFRGFKQIVIAAEAA